MFTCSLSNYGVVTICLLINFNSLIMSLYTDQYKAESFWLHIKENKTIYIIGFLALQTPDIS